MAHDDHDHGHEHGDHEHGHGAHSHEHGDHGHHHHDTPREHAHVPETPRLARGAGAGMTLFLDAFSGIAGDMTIAALVDLGVPISVVEEAVAALPLTGFHLHFAHAHPSGIVATKFDVHVDGAQPERTWSSIDAMLAASPLDCAVKALARRVFRKLGDAESAVHRTPIEDVHFHEVGAVDAIVDIVGSSACFAFLGADVVGSPLPMGRGFVKARHGILPLPAPAVVSCLAGVPTVAVEIDRELVTPTGAAIFSTVATRFARWPSFSPERVGWGAGTQTLPDRPNLLRAVLGRETGRDDTSASSHVVLEANVDDMTGELAAHAIETLLASGALDAWATPITMKKGRPALVLSALCPRGIGDEIAGVILRETTSIGVRRTDVARTERPRRVVQVDTAYGPIAVKISEGPFGPPNAKPEFDACAAAARAHGVTVRVVIEAALARVREGR